MSETPDSNPITLSFVIEKSQVRERRWSRNEHDHGLRINAVSFCLGYAAGSKSLSLILRNILRIRTFSPLAGLEIWAVS